VIDDKVVNAPNKPLWRLLDTHNPVIAVKFGHIFALSIDFTPERIYPKIDRPGQPLTLPIRLKKNRPCPERSARRYMQLRQSQPVAN
jgi:hypothetical protein